MKNLKHLLAALVFVSLIIFTSCGPDDKPKDPDPADVQAEKLVFTWNLSADGAKLESAAQSEWDGLTVTITGDGNGGSFSTNVASLANLTAEATNVWPASGTWTFDGTDIGTIVRSDGVNLDISSVTSSGLTLAFTVNSAVARTSGINGNWTFAFTN